MRDTVCFSSSFCYHFPIIPHDLPVQRIGIQIGKVIPVLDFHCQLLRIGQCRFDILILLLHFNEVRMRFADCIDHPVTTEIAKTAHPSDHNPHHNSNTIYHPYLSRGKIDPPNPRYNLPEQSVRFRIHAYIPLILRHYYP